MSNTSTIVSIASDPEDKILTQHAMSDMKCPIQTKNTQFCTYLIIVPVSTCVSGVRVFDFVKIHVSVFLVPCCGVRYEYHVNTMFRSSLLPFVLSGVHVLLMLFVFIYVYWCTMRFPGQMMFVSLSSHTTCVTYGAGIANTSEAHSQFLVDLCCSIFSFLCSVL